MSTPAIERRPRGLARHARSPSGWLALGGGFLVALSLPPWGWWPLAFVGIAAYAVALGPSPNPAERFRRGWLFGFAWMSMGMGWMWFLSAPGYVVASAIFAGFHGLAAVATPAGPARVVGLPAAHTAVEAVRLWFPFGGVPLATLGISQSAGPLLGLARVGGVLLITWVTFQVGVLLAVAVDWLASRRRAVAAARWWVPALVVSAVLLPSLAALAPTGRDLGTATRVAVVQGGGEQGTRAVDTDPRVVVERHLAATRTIGTADGVDLVLWPENVIDVGTFAGSRELEEVAAEARRLDVPFAVGVTEDTSGDRFTNAQLVITPDGTVVSRFDKVKRVPFGEYMPLRGLLDVLGAPTDLVPRDAVAGDGPAVIELPDGTRLAVVISWEVFFGSRARDGVAHGGQLIVNPTNGSSYTGTVLQTQQVASSRLRAVEQGRWVVQGAPTGFSAFISPSGTVHQRTSVSERAVIIREVPMRGGRTWYSRLGDLPFAAAAVSAVALAWFRRRRPLVQASPATQVGETAPSIAANRG